MKVVGLLLGLVAVSLGGLWLLQGIGVVHLQPLICFADCEPVQGPSASWAVIGALCSRMAPPLFGGPRSDVQARLR